MNQKLFEARPSLRATANLQRGPTGVGQITNITYPLHTNQGMINTTTVIQPSLDMAKVVTNPQWMECGGGKDH